MKTLIRTLLLTASLIIPATALADGPRDIYRDRVQIHRQMGDIYRDRAALRYDMNHGYWNRAAADRWDLHHDWRRMHRMRMDIRHDRAERYWYRHGYYW